MVPSSYQVFAYPHTFIPSLALTHVSPRFGACAEPDVVISVIEKLAANLSIPVTAKLRILSTGGIPATVAFCKRLEAAGAAIVTLHGRTKVLLLLLVVPLVTPQCCTNTLHHPAPRRTKGTALVLATGKPFAALNRH